MAAIQGRSDEDVICSILMRMLLDLNYLMNGQDFLINWLWERRDRIIPRLQGWVKGYMIIGMYKTLWQQSGRNNYLYLPSQETLYREVAFGLYFKDSQYIKKERRSNKTFLPDLSHPQLLPSPILDFVVPDPSHSSVNILNSLAPLFLHLVCLAKPSQLSPKPLQLTF